MKIPGRGFGAGPLSAALAALASLAVALAVAISAAVAADTEGTAAAQARAATLAFYDALNRADATAADKYLLPGGDSFPRSGRELDPEAPTASQSLKNLTDLFAAGLRFHVAIQDLQVKAYGKTAVATFYTSGETTAPDKTVSRGTFRATYVWVRNPDGWKIAHFHISPLVRP